VTELLDRVRAEIPRALEDLRALVAIPSISSMPDHADDVQRSAEATCELFRAEGVDARVVTTGGARPAVIGHKAGPPGAPTVLLYGHHDVQPLGAGWSRDPWALTRDGDRLYGRGSSDDKGAIAVHLAVLRAFGDELPVSVTVLIEGEEEIGSPRFAELLAGHVDELRADAIVCPDAVNPSPLQPSLTTDLRGNVDVVVTLSTIARPVHSGLYGGVLPCALTTLVQLLATLHDAEGRLAVEGIAPSSVEAPTVMSDYADLLLEGVQELPGESLASRLVTSPSITVLALDAVAVAQASNVLHPRAAAKIGVRVAPDADPTAVLDALEAHLRAHVGHGAQLEVERGRAGLGFHGRPRSDAWARAAKEAFGTESIDIGVGGSIPFLTALQEVNPEADFFVTAVQDSGSQAHSFDESLHVPGFEAAVVAHALLLRNLGAG
jgi:acetylornithine deacetylase/succinyl-diaminopimelate desuccinylase-like protein